MRIPETPPPFHYLLTTTVVPSRWTQLLAMNNPVRPQEGEYLHWDDLQTRNSPAGLSKEEWWLMMKTGRQFARQELPLIDKKGQPFRFSIVPEMFEALHHIDQSCAGNIAMTEHVSKSAENSATQTRYKINSLMEEAVTSSLLEGAALLRRLRQLVLHAPAWNQQFDAPVTVFDNRANGEGNGTADGMPAVHDGVFAEQDDLAVADAH